MKKQLTAIALACLLTLAGAARGGASSKETVQLAKSVYSSVVLLYSQDEGGGMAMRCTATAYRTVEKATADGKSKVKMTRLVSAAHCVSGDTEEQQHAGRYFITADTAGSKTFVPATLVEAGDKRQGDDFSIFEVTTDVSLTPLGDSDKISIADPVVNVASPLGLGKQFFEGYVSMVLLDRPPLDAREVVWTSVMLVQIGGGPGSSGSAIVGEEQKAIIGFLVGSFNANIGAICVPVSKFKAFESAVDAGKYTKTKAPTPEKTWKF